MWLISLAMWLGCCTLGFPEPREESTHSNKNCQPSLLKARWARSVFHWYDHLASIFVPSIGLEDIIAHIEALTKFTQQGFDDSRQSLSLLNTEMCLVRKAILQKRMALDVIAALQGGTGCCVFAPDESANGSSLLNHMRTQVIALSDPTPFTLLHVAIQFSQLYASF